MLQSIFLVSFVLFSFAAAASGTDFNLLQHYLSGNSFGAPGQNATYDYVVIGGGTAGNAIAARLAEDLSIRVAVVEAGGFYEIDSGNRSVVPAYASGNQAAGVSPNPLTDWGFVTTPQAGILDRSLDYARGKTLGGSSALNFMVYQRGTLGSYQAWADAVDDQSYTFDNVLSFFQKSSHFTPPDNKTRFTNTTLNFEPAAFNNSLGGPVQVSFSKYAAPIASWAQLGLEEIGIPINGGMSLGKLLGSDWVPNTINPKDGHRSSSQTSYLDNAISNTPLTVYTQALVKRILFTPNKTVSGIEVETAGHKFYLKAMREVILSAGAINSPQLLMVSGIGPKETLSSLSIPIISELPGVGQNMWDHARTGIVSYQVGVTTASLLLNTTSPYTYAAEAAFTANGTGPLTNASPYVGWEIIPESYQENFTSDTKDGLSKFPQDWPQLEYLVTTSFSGSQPVSPSTNYATLSNAIITPFSRGNVTINSTSTSDPPIISPNWLTHPSDIQLAIAGFKRIREFWTSKVMAGVIVGEEFTPGSTVSTDEEIEQYIRETAGTVWHASCTCKMGLKNDSMAVVDNRARVFGVSGLRVVDASAFPFLPPGHPQSTVYMLAEKIADDILKGRKT